MRKSKTAVHPGRHLLDLLTPEGAPASTTNLHRLDESTYVKDKMAAREAAATNAGPFGILLEAVAGEGELQSLSFF